jgi:hypothetical protein
MLKVLSYTFVIGMETSVAHLIPVQPIVVPPNMNAVLHQLGLPAIRMVAPNPIPQPNLTLFIQQRQQHPQQLAQQMRANLDAQQVREIPFRPPLAMLVMLYFVAPARKPVIGILILGWVAYEGWRPVLGEAGCVGQQQLHRPHWSIDNIYCAAAM